MSIDLATAPPPFPFPPSPLDALVPAVTVGPGVTRVILPSGRLAWLVSRHEDVRQLLRSPAFTSDSRRAGFPLLREQPPPEANRRDGFFILMDPPDHTRFRRLLTPEFMIKSMKRLEPLIEETVAQGVSALREAGPPADLVQLFALPVPSMVICHLLGVPYEDHTFFQERSRILVDRSVPGAEVMRASGELRAYLAELVARKQRDGGPDLLGRLATDRVATGEITTADLIGMSVLLLIAGHETTSNMIGLSALVLLRQREHWERLRARPERIDDAVEELLRYLTIVRTGLLRLATEDVEIGGQLIRAGEGAIALLAGANRDPDVFGEPEALDLDRGSHQHVAFGFGIHQCIGQPLARTELRIALRELLAQFPGLALAIEPSEVELRHDAIVLGAARLPVTW